MEERQRLNHGFDALSDPTRRKLIELIVKQPGLNIGDACAHFSITRFSIMRHLNILEIAGLLSRERRGTEKLLYIETDALEALSSGWIRRVIDTEEEQ